MKSLRRQEGAEWAAADTPLVAFPQKGGKEYLYTAHDVTDLPKEGKQLTLRFQSDAGGVLSLSLRLYPTGAVVHESLP